MESDTGRLKKTSDGLYEWYYDHKKPFNKTFWVTILIVCGSLGLIFTGILFFAPANSADPDFRWTAMAILYGILIFTFFLAIGIQWLIYRVQGGFCRHRFRMTREDITVIYDQQTASAVRKMGRVVAVAGVLAGQPGQGLGYAAGAGAFGDVTMRFDKVRKITLREAEDTVRLRTLITFMPVMIPPEDYRQVKDYILEHVNRNVKIVEK